MDNPPWNNKGGATPRKLVLIFVLGIVLVSVICFQLGAGNGSAESPQRDRRAEMPAPPVDQPPEGTPETPAVNAETRTVREWPEIPLETVLAHDPFELPPAMAPPTPNPSPNHRSGERADRQESPASVEKRERALATVRDVGIRMVLVDQEERVALVGERAVRVGEVLEGFRVIAIDADGITLSDLPVE
ncbi:MAG: hypothetical protein ACODAD_09465 [Planctomycetota bacterium]